MASVNFHKCKAGTGEAGALIRHCDKQERLKHDHGNEHVDKELTDGNMQFRNSTYRQTMDRLRQRLAELDAQPGANRRKDRVECFMLEIPIPHGYDIKRFAEMAVREIAVMYGKENVLNAYVHVDEVHEYLDHGDMRKSLSHIHVPVVPEVDGKLNGKAFSSRQNMIALNQRIDRAARHELGGPGFLTGTAPRRRTVEELKAGSVQEAREAIQEARRAVETAEADKSALTEQNALLEASASVKQGELRDLQAQVVEQQALLEHIRHEIKAESDRHQEATRRALRELAKTIDIRPEFRPDSFDRDDR